LRSSPRLAGARIIHKLKDEKLRDIAKSNFVCFLLTVEDSNHAGVRVGIKGKSSGMGPFSSKPMFNESTLLPTSFNGQR
jgi:hypothetical protein